MKGCEQAPSTVCTTLHFLHNLQMGPIRQSVTLDQFGKSCKFQTLQLIGSICKTSGSYLQRSIFFVTYKWPNKLECYISLALGLTNSQAYKAYSKEQRKFSVVDTQYKCFDNCNIKQFVVSLTVVNLASCQWTCQRTS